MVTLYNPASTRPLGTELPSAPRIDTLRGKLVGILWNEKPNGDILLGRIEKRLHERFGIAGSLWKQKHPAERTSEAMLKEFAEKCDFILNGIGD